jgi:putative hydrolase of the HAD superfamily
MSIKNKVIVFDLDDTLYKEIDFLKSAYLEIASIVDKDHCETLYDNMISNYYKGENVFKLVSEMYPTYTIERLLKIYREHYPSISLSNEEWNVLLKLKTEAITGLITDGRSLTQRNKIKALGLENYFDKIVISEEIGYSKPDIRLFNEFKKYDVSQYYYVANDTRKDFVTPNRIGWITICLLDVNNRNIQKQDFSLSEYYLPQIKIKTLNALLNII